MTFYGNYFELGSTNSMLVGMTKYYSPTGMRYTTLEERNRFYTQEFNLQKVFEWFKCDLGKTKFAVIIGRHTRIYPEKYKHDLATTIIIDEYKNLDDFRQQVVEFLPEACYYDRNIYGKNNNKVGQELAFDLDPENLVCPIHGNLADKMKRRQALSFCEIELEMVKKEAIGLNDFLEKRFSEIEIVYSGRGFHIHILDRKAYSMTTQARLNIARQAKQQGFHIDEWVTSGEFRLIRLPYSLNGLVSRIAIPLKKGELESFDAIHDLRCIPQFFEKEATS